MALITTAQAKSILGISGTGKDTAFNALVPMMPTLICNYCNDNFLNYNLYYNNNTISFATRTISDSDSGFVDAEFVASMDIYVSGSYHNDGHYLISSTAVTATNIVVDSSEDAFTAESAEASVTIYQVQYPKGLRIAVAHLMNYLAENTSGVSSESIGDYSVSFMAQMPAHLRILFNPYRKLGWV